MIINSCQVFLISNSIRDCDILWSRRTIFQNAQVLKGFTMGSCLTADLHQVRVGLEEKKKNQTSKQTNKSLLPHTHPHTHPLRSAARP